MEQLIVNAVKFGEDILVTPKGGIQKFIGHSPVDRQPPWPLPPTQYDTYTEKVWTTSSVRTYPTRVMARLLYLDVKASSNSSDWGTVQDSPAPGLILTKNGLRATRPKKPVYRLPKMLVYTVPKVPKTLISSSVVSKRQAELVSVARLNHYRKGVERAKTADARNQRVKAAYDKTYQLRLAKYMRRLSYFELLVEKAAKPKARKALSFKTPHYHEEHAFRRIQANFEQGSFSPYKKNVTVSKNDSYEATKRANDTNLSHYPGPHAFVWNYEFTSWCTALHSMFNYTRTDKSQIAGIGASIHSTVMQVAEKELADYDARLSRKTHDKIKRQAVHIGNLLAERKQTLELISTTFKRLYELIKLKKRVLQAVGNYIVTPKKLANDVLAFKFGVEPLINDMHALIKFYDENSDTIDVVVRSNLGGMKLEPFSFSRDGVTFDGKIEMSYVVKCTNIEPVATMLNRFGLINPLEIAWEVTPWSFVVDWFIPVGEWIAAQTSDVGLQFRTGTRKVKLTGSFRIGDTDPASVYYRNETYTCDMSPPCVFDGQIIDRKVLTELPGYGLPALKNPWSWSHVVESAALIVQRLKGQRRPSTIIVAAPF